MKRQNPATVWSMFVDATTTKIGSCPLSTGTQQ